MTLFELKISAKSYQGVSVFVGLADPYFPTTARHYQCDQSVVNSLDARFSEITER